MGIRVETLDAEVSRVRTQIRDDEAFHSALSTLHSPLPWPQPVNGAELLTQVFERFRHYLILPPGAPEAFTLWSAHAHCFSAFIQTPRLNISSPEPGCGKTTALDVIASLTPRALRTENLTAPVLFRLVHQYQPTLLLDEVDAWLAQADELRGLLNAGHKRGACAYRCEGEGNAVRPFRAFGPAVLSGIGQLTGTLHDRSIVVPLMKAEPGEIPHRFDDHHIEIETELSRKLARWTSDNLAAIKSCEPALPPTAFNRLADNWRPLFVIAQIAGAPWLDLAHSSFNQLVNPLLSEAKSRSEIGIPLALPPPPPPLLSSSSSSFSSSSSISESSSSSSSSSAVHSSTVQGFTTNSDITNSNLTNCLGSQLFAAIRAIFTQSGASRLSSTQLAEALSALPQQPSSGTCRAPTRLTPITLSRRLRPFGIVPKVMRFGDHLAKGYDLADFPQSTDPTKPRP